MTGKLINELHGAGSFFRIWQSLITYSKELANGSYPQLVKSNFHSNTLLHWFY